MEMGDIGRIVGTIGEAGVGRLVERVGLDRATAERAVPAGVETILGQLAGGKAAAGGLLGGAAGALGGLLGGGGAALPDPDGAARELAGKVGLDTGKAGAILSALLPLVLQALGGGGSGSGSPLGGLFR